MFDFIKAFNTLRAETLIAILESCYLYPITPNLFDSDLINPRQCVKLGSEISMEQYREQGILQGSIYLEQGCLLYTPHKS